MRSEEETTGAHIICPRQNKGGGLIKGTCKVQTGLKEISDQTKKELILVPLKTLYKNSLATR
jgi:hypothetical protein